MLRSYVSSLWKVLKVLWRYIFPLHTFGNSNSNIHTTVSSKSNDELVPLSVNYFPTRQCNYNCGFCFHTAKTSFVLPFEDAKRGLSMLVDAGMKKLNFSGGEPFLEARFMGELIKYCKTELSNDLSTSIISNGSKITEKWMSKYGEFLDIIAISCDSFDGDTNRMIGRYSGPKTEHVAKLLQIREWCDKYHVAFKLNTVVNTLNLTEDFTENIAQLRPIRWKVFQCLLLEGENAGPGALRDAERFYVTDEQFDGFLKRHAHIKSLVPESNKSMKDSYLLLDEYMRFLDCRNGKKEPSDSLLDVGVRHALDKSGFDEEAFKLRGGVYVWSKHELEKNGELDW